MPLTYVVPIQMTDHTKLVLGMNFIDSWKGGINIEQGRVSFYKKTDIVNTFPLSKPPCEYLKTIDEDLEYNESQWFNLTGFNNKRIDQEKTGLIRDHKLLNKIRKLEQTDIFREDPTKAWSKSQVTCKLDIINPDISISCKIVAPSPADEEDFKKQIEKLLQIKVIQPSKSRHRSNAFLVRKHSEIVRGEPRMVYNYKDLNANTYPDKYPIPYITHLITRIKDRKFYSKFDLKSGFWQIPMDKESIEWTSFIIPQGITSDSQFEWLAMPFGLKNAPSVFQRKMDNIFGTYNFITVYIDDILVASSTLEEHYNHLNKFFDLCEQHGLVLSKRKTVLGQTNISFLGVEVGRPQPHLLKSIMETKEEAFTDIKSLQSFLGKLNYIRPFVPNMAKLVGPLYQKVSAKSNRVWTKQDSKIFEKIRTIICNLPDLSPPLKDSYLIVETDGSFEGWGGILKWRPKEFSQVSEEKIAAYCSGNYKSHVTALDAEILACIFVLEKFKIYLFSAKKFTLRTDCKSIVSFYHSNLSSKRSIQVNRWLRFYDFITGNGLQIDIAHISGKNNKYADLLSRLISYTKKK